MRARSSRAAARRRRKPRRPHPGSSPGLLVVDPEAPRSVVTLLAYGPDGCEEKRIDGMAAVREALARWPVVWVNVDGLGDADTIRDLGAVFELHKLAIEDVVHVHQRTKLEPYDNHVFLILRLPVAGERLESEQISLFLGRNFVVTFQEQAGDCFEPVRERIRGGKGTIRGAGPDYLAYALIDAGVDSNFPVLEAHGERLDELEEEIVARPGRGAMAALHTVRRDLLTLRRGIWPLRETLGALSRDSSPFVSAETRLYLRDCYDHAVQIIELLETYREIAGGLLDIYLSSVSNRMNEIMKVLTIIATIFIPLSFVAGLYGMNFDPSASPWNMPELHWRWGYPLALGIMAAVAGGLLLYFRRKGWLGGDEPPPPSR